MEYIQKIEEAVDLKLSEDTDTALDMYKVSYIPWVGGDAEIIEVCENCVPDLNEGDFTREILDVEKLKVDNPEDHECSICDYSPADDIEENYTESISESRDLMFYMSNNDPKEREKQIEDAKDSIMKSVKAIIGESDEENKDKPNYKIGDVLNLEWDGPIEATVSAIDDTTITLTRGNGKEEDGNVLEISFSELRDMMD